MTIKDSFPGMRFLRPQRSAAESIARGDAARDSKAWADAAGHYAAALEDEPEREAIWVQLGHCLKESGNYGEAEQAYRRALAIRADSADTHLHLGHLLKLAGRKGEAVAAYMKCHELAPASADAIIELQILSPTPVRQAAVAGQPTAQEVRDFRDLMVALKNSNAGSYWIFDTEPMQSV